MIEKIRIKNFKSYAEAELPLSSLTFLIGANASGKSNALEAIRLLSWLAKGSRLEDISKNIQGKDQFIRGQAADLFQKKQSPFSLGCQLSAIQYDWTSLDISISLLADDQLAITGEEVTKNIPMSYVDLANLPLYKVDSPPGLHSDEISVMYNNFKKGGNKPHIPCSNRQAIFYQLESPGRFEAKHQESQKVIPAVTKVYRENLKRIIFLDPRPAAMRDYSYEKDNEMKEDGSNLSSVLFHVCKDDLGKQRLLDFIRSLPEQNITDIKFIETERRDVMVRLVESFGGQVREIDAPLLSDGTLRVLAVAGVLLGSPSGSFVVIEEIDNGVHPSRAENLVRQIQKAGMQRNLRILVTTHNPALLDALPNNALGDVLCCYRDLDRGDSRIVRLGDSVRFPELVAQASLGELVTTQVLDRFLKDKTTEEERAQKSLEWLEQFKREVSQ
ncbi:MAG: AAA family ATPase [Planctomycetaceae bacterium]